MNYRHLQYFLRVAECGSIARASELLHVSPQTISGQLQVLEARLGRPLFFKVRGRLRLTDAGRVALDYARDIFALGAELEAAVRDGSGDGRARELRVGIADAVPKSIARRILDPLFAGGDPIRIVCREWRLDRLLAELGCHRLDLVIADAPPPASLGERVVSRRLEVAPVAIFGMPSLLRRHPGRFPARLDGAPMLLPGEDAVTGQRLRAWLAEQGVRPRTIGELDDAALAFELGGCGRAFFAAPAMLADELERRIGAVVAGIAVGVDDEVHAISIRRRLEHPSVAAVFDAATDGADSDMAVAA